MKVSEEQLDKYNEEYHTFMRSLEGASPYIVIKKMAVDLPKLFEKIYNDRHKQGYQEGFEIGKTTAINKMIKEN